ncbi:hypothetical protein ACJMK2_040122 [Sinanodonta woodiana]|uniref:Uncharacterized protein n=1 Tax=Sinanodonta woodiana TaxID=1069815 RepID=A0ABD3WF24_SINWO
MNIFYSLLLTLTFIMILQKEVYGKGNCFFHPLHFSYAGNRIVYKCVHHDLEYLIGTKFSISDCYRCHCDLSGFFCCGIGINAGKIHIPGGHKVVQHGCDYTIEKHDGDE